MHLRRRRRTRSRLRSGLTAAAGLVLLLVAVPNAGPALRAARADGEWGMFTAERLECVSHPGHEACSWYGMFSPAGGGDHMSGVALYGSGRGSVDVGERVVAVDVGRSGRVYRPSGSREWIPVAGVAVLGLVLVLAGVRGLRPASRVELARRSRRDLLGPGTPA